MLVNCGENTHRLARNVAYIPRYVSVHPHQVNHYIKYFDALFLMVGNNLYGFVQRCASSTNFLVRLLQMSGAFYKSSFFQNYSMLLHDGDQLK